MTDKNSETHRYDDIIHLPHHVSATHPQMPVADRAAQFSPFAALTGHDAAIAETARLTDERVELDDNAKELLNEKLRLVQEMMTERPEITITYFQPDDMKTGGSYATVTGNVKRIDANGQFLLMTDGTQIPIEEIFGIESEAFGFNM